MGEWAAAGGTSRRREAAARPVAPGPPGAPGAIGGAGAAGAAGGTAGQAGRVATWNPDDCHVTAVAKPA